MTAPAPARRSHRPPAQAVGTALRRSSWSLSRLASSAAQRARYVFLVLTLCSAIALIPHALMPLHTTPGVRVFAAAGVIVLLSAWLTAYRMGRLIERTERERERASVLAALGAELIGSTTLHEICRAGLDAATALVAPAHVTGSAVLAAIPGGREVIAARGALAPSEGSRLSASDLALEWRPRLTLDVKELDRDAAWAAAARLGWAGASDHVLVTRGEAALETGAPILVIASSAPFSDEARVQIGVVAQQIALAAALESSRRALLQAERLAAIGQLAASVGHELRNPLAAIRSAAAFLRRRITPPTGDRVPEFFDIIEREVKASNRIITELLDFARSRPLLRAPTDLHALIEEVREIVPLGRAGLVNAISPDLPVLMLDRDQVRQALANLIQNAADAAPPDRDGEITVRASLDELGLRIEIEDDGDGMPPDVAARAFEPLFTTKSKGTGLGLAIVNKIVAAHDGKIRVEAREPRGARFIIELPPDERTSSF